MPYSLREVSYYFVSLVNSSFTSDDPFYITKLGEMLHLLGSYHRYRTCVILSEKKTTDEEFSNYFSDSLLINDFKKKSRLILISFPINERCKLNFKLKGLPRFKNGIQGKLKLQFD